MESNLKTIVFTGPLLILMMASFAQATSVARSPEWRALLHFQKDIFGQARSEIEVSDFFLSPEGWRDPEAELDATIEAFKKPVEYRIGPYDQHPQCAFPARARFLKQYISFPAVDCPLLRNWKKKLQAQSLSLIYAAPYLGNPASMFGHTFLRFNSGRDLVDGSVSFDAIPGHTTGLMYAWNGLVGGFQGQFSIQPYYQKIKTYSEVENRSLWEFDLDLTQDEVEFVAEHLWELGTAKFDYYFIDENCSYQVMALLDVIRPSWNLRRGFSTMTVPLDTVRSLSRERVLKAAQFRPSAFDVLLRRLAALSVNERREFEEIRRHPETAKLNSSAAVYDVLLDWHRYQVSNRVEGGAPFSSELEQKLLFARSEAGVITPTSANFENHPPQEGHRTSKVSAFGFSGPRDRGVGLQLRPLIHDMFDDDLGYAKYSTLVVGQTEVLYNPEENRLVLGDIVLADVINLQPTTSLVYRSSWMASAKVIRATDLDCADCFIGDLTAGWGLSTEMIERRLLLSVLAKARLQLSNSFRQQDEQIARYAPALSTFALWDFGGFGKAGVEAEHALFLTRFDRSVRPETNLDAVLAIPFRALSADIRMTAGRRLRGEETSGVFKLAWGYYF